MSIHGSVDINRKCLISWAATRVTPLTQPREDEICTYTCTVIYPQDDPKPKVFELRHRYGDGAEALAAAVLTRGAQ